MKNVTTRFLLFLLPILFVLNACHEDQLSPTLTRHLENFPDIQKKYVYQSLIRLANVSHDPGFEKLIKDVNKVIIYLPPQGDSTYQITALSAGMRTDGYEQLVSVRTADGQRITLWVKEVGSKAHYMALLDTAESDIILEIDGQINLEYLAAIKVADQESLKGFLEGGF